MKKLFLIAMIALGVIACTKEKFARSLNNEATVMQPIIGDVPFEFVYNDNIATDLVPESNIHHIYEVPDLTTWKELIQNQDDYSDKLKVNFDTHRVLIIPNGRALSDFPYAFTIVSVIGDDNEIVISSQTTLYSIPYWNTGLFVFPGVVIKIPKTNQSLVLQKLPDLEIDNSDDFEE